jgi:hypothetical protein
MSTHPHIAEIRRGAARSSGRTAALAGCLALALAIPGVSHAYTLDQLLDLPLERLLTLQITSRLFADGGDHAP